MATQAQIDANRRNAQTGEPVRPYPPTPAPPSNTPGQGPRTEAGKANSSRNATRFGLFATNNCVLPGEEEIYDHLCHSLWDELAPVGAIEDVTAAEYVRAIWLLRRCAVAAQRLGEYSVRRWAEDNLKCGTDRPPADPMLRDDCLPCETATSRARAQADNARRRAKSDLDKLQAERRARTPQLQIEAEPAPATEPDPITKPTRSQPAPQPPPTPSDSLTTPTEPGCPLGPRRNSNEMPHIHNEAA